MKADDEVKAKVVKTLKENGVPVPQSLTKASKLEKDLAHVLIEHLYVGVYSHLKIATAELKSLSKKSDHSNVLETFDSVTALTDIVESTLNRSAEQFTSIPSFDEINEVVEKLTKELEYAALLDYTADGVMN